MRSTWCGLFLGNLLWKTQYSLTTISGSLKCVTNLPVLTFNWSYKLSCVLLQQRFEKLFSRVCSNIRSHMISHLKRTLLLSKYGIFLFYHDTLFWCNDMWYPCTTIFKIHYHLLITNWLCFIGQPYISLSKKLLAIFSKVQLEDDV